MMSSSHNISEAQLAMDELLAEIQVPVAQMDGSEDPGIIDDLTFAELFTQDAIFKDLETEGANKKVTTPTSAQLAISPTDLFPNFLTASSSAIQSPPAFHNVPNSQAPAITPTATAAAFGAVVGKSADNAQAKLPGQGELETPEWDGIIPDKFENLKEEMISLIPHREFAKLMARSQMTEKQIVEAKKLRRRVKNRQSARVCSTRKRLSTKATEFTNAELHSSIADLTRQNQTLLKQHLQLQQEVVTMQKAQQEAIREKLSMEAELHRMEKLLQDAMKSKITENVTAVSAASTAPMDFPLPDTLFAIAA